MAAGTSYFHRLSIKQIEMLARRRQQSGAHAYYTQVFDINRVQMKIALPQVLSNSTVLCALYEYTRPIGNEVTVWALHLAKLPLEPLSSIRISGAYHIALNWEGQTLATHKNTFESGAIQGFHVLEFTMEDTSIVAFVDGKQIIPKGLIVGREKHLTTFLGWNTGKEPYRMWEVHFTSSYHEVEFNLAYGFPHIDFKLQAWGYVEFSGFWKDKAEIKEEDHVLAELKTRGKALLKLNVYPTQVTARNELDKSGTENVIRRTQIDLGKLTCTQPTALYNITVVVGDYGK